VKQCHALLLLKMSFYHVFFLNFIRSAMFLKYVVFCTQLNKIRIKIKKGTGEIIFYIRKLTNSSFIILFKIES
jgi:hypothetical protein